MEKEEVDTEKANTADSEGADDAAEPVAEVPVEETPQIDTDAVDEAKPEVTTIEVEAEAENISVDVAVEEGNEVSELGDEAIEEETEALEEAEESTVPEEGAIPDEQEPPPAEPEPIPEEIEPLPAEEEENEAEEVERKLIGLEEMEGEDAFEYPINGLDGRGDMFYEMEGEGYEELPQRTSGVEDMLLEAKRQSLEAPPPEPDLDVKDEPSRPKVFICTEDETNRTIQMESYCCQQIRIPPMLPHILKSFTKAAIRTQPRDILRWSVAYFRALANDEPPPVKDRLEYPTVESPCGLTKGLLRVLHKQLGKNEQVLETQLREKWTGVCLDEAELTKLLHLNSLNDVFGWTKFVIVAAASIVNDHIVEAMSVFCDTMTQQPDGVDPYVPYDLFADAYTFLADKMGVDIRQAGDVCLFLRDLSKANFDLVGPKDFMAPECPPLF